MKIIVTGAAGFIGSHTAELLQKYHSVLAIDNFTTGRTENLSKFKGSIQPGDICDHIWLERIFIDFQPEVIIHLAAQSAITTSMAAPQHDLKVNGIGTLNLLTLSKKYKVSRFVFSSTSAVYSDQNTFFPIKENFKLDPSSPYGISKLACEKYIRLLFPNHLIMRYGNVYGPRQRPIGDNLVIARALAHFIHGDSFKVNGSGNQKRDFVYVGDVAQCNMMAATGSSVGTYNVSSGKSYSVNTVLSMLENIFSVPGYSWEHNKNEDPRKKVSLNVSKIGETGWTANTSLFYGLCKTCEWWEVAK